MLNANKENLEVFQRKMLAHKKKRALSHNSLLHRMHWKLILVSFLMGGVGAIYPIINFVITNDFLNEFHYNV